MNARNHFFICILALLCFASSAAQNYPINAATNGTTILTCQGTIYDSGGPSGNYGNSQLYTVTFCSSNGSQLILDVLQFQIENFFDDLFVYDGPTTSSPLIVQATGNQIQGQSFTTTGTCVTLVFDTDGSVTNVGFAIDINCAFPCQAIEPQIAVDPLLTLGPNDEILACTGSQVTFNGSALFPENGTTYIQSIATSTFEWYVNGTLVFTGLDFIFEPMMPGQYTVELEVTDLEGCSNLTSVTETVIVTGEGSFFGTTSDLPPICVGDIVPLTGTYTNEPIIIEVEQENDIFPGNPLFFPGGPIQLSSELTVSGFPAGQTITDIDQIDAICIVMEHSYVGDLDITVICPDGTEVILLDEEFGGNNLGNTNTGFEYCFSPDAPPGNTLDYQNISPIPAGQYAPFESMNAFVGCDINGTWDIVINDNLFADDGFLFDWYIQFDEDFVGNQNGFPETVLSSQWLPDPTIILDNGDQIVVQPDAPGQYCYTYEVTTEFCSHDTIICIDVEDGPAIVFAPVEELCAGQDPIQLLAAPAGGVWSGAASPTGLFNPTTAGTFTAIYQTASGPGTCPSIESLQITVGISPSATISGGGVICDGSDATVLITLDGIYDWTVIYAIDGVAQPPLVFNGTSVTFDAGAGGTYTLISATNGVCDASISGSAEIVILPEPVATISGDETICSGGSAEFMVEFEGTGPYTFDYAINGVAQGSITTTDNPYVLTADQPGTYTLISFTPQSCTGVTGGVATLAIFSVATATLSGDASLCSGDDATLQIAFIGNGPYIFEYAIDGLGQGLITTSDNPYTFDTSTIGTYTLVSFSDANCVGSTAGDALIEALASPTATMSGGGVICPGTSTEIVLDFIGTGPFEFEYFLNGVSQGLLSTAMNPFIFTTGVEGEFTFSNFSDAICPGTASGSATIEVLDEPVATISGGGSICPGDEVDLQVTFEGTGPYTFEYALDGVSQGSVTTSDAVYTFPVGVTGTYTILTFSTANCTGTGNGQAVVNATAIPTAMFAQTSLSFCPNEVNTLPINLGGPGPWTIEWSIDGIPQTNITTSDTPYVLDIEEEGSYTIEVVSTGNCIGTGGNSLSVTELALPSAILSGQDIVCPGTEGQLSVDFTGTGPWTVNYTIDGFASGTETFTDVNSIWSVFGEGQYSLTSVSDANCSNTTSGIGQLDFYEIPDAVFLETQSTICSGDSFEFPLSLSGTAPYTVSYSLDGVPQTELTSASELVILTFSEEGTYVIEGISDANCASTPSSSAQLDFFPPLTASIDGPALFCVGDTISLAADLQGGNGQELTFQWIDGDGQVFDTSSLDYIMDSPQTFTLTVNDGCEVPFSTSEILFIGQTYPQPEVLAGLDSVCAGSSVAFTHLDEIGPVSCIWTFSDGNTAVGCSTINEVFEDAGTVSLSLTTSTTAGCATTLVIDTVLEVIPVPQADFEFKANPGNIYAPTVLFFNISSYATDYLWDFGDGSTSDDEDSVHDFPGGEALDYTVCLEAINELGCVDSTCARVPIETIFAVFIPNAFTPDGDAVNDCFAPVINDVELAEYEFMVFDPWGLQVYQSFDREDCWNGRGAEDENYYAGSAIYSYRLLVRAADSAEKLEFTGTVVLLR